VQLFKPLLEAHFRILRKLERAGSEGVVASELIPDRAARESVLRILSSNGLIRRRRRFRGERIYITRRGLTLLESMEEMDEPLENVIRSHP